MFKKIIRLTIVYTLIATLVNFQLGSLGVSSNLNLINSSYAADSIGVFEGDKTGDGSWLSAITMIAIGVIAGSLYKCRVKTMDTITAAAGGAMYIFGEIQNFGKYKTEEVTLAYNYDENGVMLDSDRKALEEQRALYVKTKETLESKKGMQTAAAAAFAAAAALAYWGHYQLEKSRKGCEIKLKAVMSTSTSGQGMCNGNQVSCDMTSGTSAYVSTCTGEGATCSGYLDEPVGSCIGRNCSTVAGKLAKCSVSLTKAQGTLKQVKAYEAKHELSDKQSEEIETGNAAFISAIEGCTGYAPKGHKAMVAVCKKYDKLLKKSLNKCTQAVTSTIYNESSISDIVAHNNLDFLDKLLFILETGVKKTVQAGCNAIIPEANALAFNASMIGAAGAAAGIIMGVMSKKVNFIDKYLATYMHRAVVFGLLAGLAYLAAGETKKTIDKLDEYIRKIDEILARLNENSYGSGLDASGIDETKLVSGTALDGASSSIIPSQDYTPVYDNSTPCITANCSPVEGELYNATDAEMMNGLTSQGSSGSAILSAAKKASKIGSGIQGKKKISAGTMNAMNGLGGQLNALNSAANKIKRAINSARVAGGEAPIDFAAMNEKMLNGIKLDGAKALKSMGYDPAKDPRMSGGNSAGASSKEISGLMSGKKKAAAVEVNYSTASKGGGNIFEEDKFGKNFDHSSLANEKLDSAGELAKYNNSASDIAGKGVSLWKVISSRYIKSGMKRVLGLTDKGQKKK